MFKLGLIVWLLIATFMFLTGFSLISINTAIIISQIWLVGGMIAEKL